MSDKETSPLRARALSCHAPQGRPLVCGLDLGLQRGEVLALIGPNGSGKSTLLRALAALRPPREGQIELQGTPLEQVPDKQRARTMAFLPQRANAPAPLRVRELVMLGRAPHLGWMALPKAEDQAAVEEAMRRCDVTELAARPVGSLSGGERQRVMLARMLATQSEILALDEPTTALDVGHALRLLGMLRELASAGRSVLVALHELELAQRFADRVLCLHGDGSGSWTLGTTTEVLVPQVLDPVFGVRTHAHEHGLHFEIEKP